MHYDKEIWDWCSGKNAAVRLRNCLMKMKREGLISCIADLRDLPEVMIKSYPNLGKVTYTELQRLLAEDAPSLPSLKECAAMDARQWAAAAHRAYWMRFGDSA